MISTTLLVGGVIVAVAAVIALLPILYTKYPIWFYLPGTWIRIRHPLSPYKSMTWRVPEKAVERGDKPNVVIIVADDLGINDLWGGNTGIETPNIQSIAAKGVRFPVAYSGHATCSPSRASLLTGRYATRFGFEYTAVTPAFSWAIAMGGADAKIRPIYHKELVDKLPPMSDMIVPLNETMISSFLKDREYATAYVGKWHLGESKGAQPHERGFDETLTFLKGAALYGPVSDPDIVTAPLGSTMDDFLLANLRYHIEANGQYIYQPNEYMTDYLANEAVKMIRSKTQEGSSVPYFLVVAFNAPHNPFQALRSDYNAPDVAAIPKHRDRVYGAMIKALDRGVGTILSAIESSGQGDNTLVVFTSDNGAPGTTYMPAVNAPFRGWKATFFEGGVRVPLFMQWPRMIRPGSVLDQPVAHVDIFTTVVSATMGKSKDDLEHEMGRVYDGVDLLQHIATLNQAARNVSFPIVEVQGECAHDVPGSCLPPVTHSAPHESLFWRSGHYIAMRVDDMKMQVADMPDKVWLFNMTSDPVEGINLTPNICWSGLRDLILKEEGQGQGQGKGGIEGTWEGQGGRCVDGSVVGVADVDVGVRTALLRVARRLVLENALQRDPLWPALCEVPVPIDRTGRALGPTDEYVYWSN